ncbi:MAG TPA: hypothetical protein P5060_01100 [Candidatus Absconditabacterales bacterium]|nr:hypothetical protein [Candidatus Absconditabacterales bacterium]
MIIQFIILCIIIFLGPILPPLLIPLSYSLTGAMLIQHANPVTLSILSVGTATLSTTLIRFSQNYIMQKIESTNKKGDKNSALYKITKRLKKGKRLQKLSNTLRKYANTKHGKFAMFFITIACYLPIIPDLITTRILYKKIKFPYFLIALIIGKSITHIPFIFLGKGIRNLVSSRM